MRTIYSIGITFYGLGVRSASLFNLKARQMVKGWREAKRIIQQSSKRTSETPLAWFHASSLGEFEQARPVLEQFKSEHPEHKILVTFFSPSGYEVRKNYPQADTIIYLPLDTRRNARKLIKGMKPSVAFFVKYDFWFNYLRELRRHQIPTYIFSAIFRPSQYFFKPYGRWFLKQLNGYNHLFVQNKTSLELLKSHGINHCTVAGDTRFDRVDAIAKQAARNEVVERFIGPDNTTQILMAGSSWEPDEAHLKRYLQQTQNSKLKTILAPHVISESHLSAIEQLFGKDSTVRYSVLAQSNDEVSNNRKILIIDNIGMLASLYRYATVAYIGGGWGDGIHNTLEAITFGKPVVFGPRYGKFQEAHDIIERKGGWSYDKYETLESVLDSLFKDPDHYHNAVDVCKQYVAENIGSTNIILNHCKQPSK